MGWFLIDAVSVIPLDLLFEHWRFNKICRFLRIGKIYKLITVTKMVKLLERPKYESKFLMKMHDLMQLGAGVERLLSLLLTFMIL